MSSSTLRDQAEAENETITEDKRSDPHTNDDNSMIPVLKWLIFCVLASLLPLILSIGVVVIADFGWNNVEWKMLLPDYLLIVFTVSLNVLSLALNAKGKKYGEKAQLFGVISVFIAFISVCFYFGMFSPKGTEDEYGVGSMIVLFILSTVMLVVNSVFGVKITKWETAENE